MGIGSFHWSDYRNRAHSQRIVTFSQIQQYTCRTAAERAAFQLRVQRTDIDVMRGFPGRSVDLIVTDPLYLVGFKDGSGRQIAGDVTDEWLQPAVTNGAKVGLPQLGWRKIDETF